MGTIMNQTLNRPAQVIERLRAGDNGTLGELFDRYRDLLRRMVGVCMDSRPQVRVDARWVGRDLSHVYKHQFSRLWPV
jgi:hypothetical protein